MRDRRPVASIVVFLFVWALACDRQDSSLAAPRQIAPDSGMVLEYREQRATTLVWAPVPGAATYALEVDPFCVDEKRWCTEIGATRIVYTASAIADTTHAFNHVGAQPGRWRVWAVDRAGNAGPKSGWWEFVYTQ
jgi:hypothetical protein